MAPFTPLLSEYIFLSLRPLLRKDFRAASVHFLPFPVAAEGANSPGGWRSQFPVPAEGASSPGLEEKVARMQAVIVAGRAARDRRQVSLRTPLALATVVLPDQSLVDDLSAMESYILQELNLRAIVFTTQDHPATGLGPLTPTPSTIDT
ncbi:hypothetical protein T484DRAFT_1796580 [Baffinella frigidus]|nr:hypothetical protein T484DRAFT_1796580 [Cryptophyta sp. CCMP2293]